MIGSLRSKIIEAYQRVVTENKDRIDNMADNILRRQELEQMRVSYKKQRADLKNALKS